MSIAKRLYSLAVSVLTVYVSGFAQIAAAAPPDVKAEIFYGIYTGPDVGVSARTPQELFQSYQQHLSKDCPAYCAVLSNLRSDPAYGLYNGKPASHLWDYEIYTNGVFYYGGTTGSISAITACPQSKPFGQVIQIGSATPADYLIYCTDPVPQQNPDVSCGKVGNPIMVGSGVKLQEEVDYVSADPDGLSMIRYYSSNRQGWVHSYDLLGINLSNASGAGGSSNACYADMTAGENPQSACFEYYSSTAEPVDFTVFRPNGFLATFTGTPTALQKPPINNDQLYPIGVNGSNIAPTGWFLFRSSDNAYEEYDTFKRLLKITLPNGKSTRLSYANGGSAVLPTGTPICSISSATVPIGKLACVTGPNGRQLSFTYDSNGKLSGFVNPEGGITTYEYDGPSAVVVPPTYGTAVLSGGGTGGGNGGSNALFLSRFRAGMITKVIYPDATSKTYFYNEQANTENSNQPFALTGIIDESGTRYATFKYNSGGAAISTEHAGGVEKYTVEGYQVTDPLGATRGYAFENKFGRLRLSSVSQPGGAGCAAATSSSSSDENLNVVYRVDFNGSATLYEYDLTRNLETLRTEAFGKPEERKITTAWHPDIRVPTQVAQAKRISYYVYNGQPDPNNSGAILNCVPPTTAPLPTTKPVAVLCKIIERATTDDTGAFGFGAPVLGLARVSTFTYSAAGSLLSAKSPRTSPAAITQFQYFSADDSAAIPRFRKGDLQQVTNPLGHTTLFQEYDPSGRIRKMTDPNGLVTTIEYSPRGWLTKVITSGGVQPQVLSMEYFPTGKLKKATQPDGAWVQFEYDPAQRLVGMVDNVNNSVRYSLDGMGNRITEENRDSTGTLSKMVARVFDALGRVQQVQGAAQ